MDDWRLRGQDEYLKNATLHKTVFPDFWEKAYAEKNAFYREVELSAHRFVEATHRGDEDLEGEGIRLFWHDHCKFCWEKVMTDYEVEFYCTSDMCTWICKECFEDFQESFHWKLDLSTDWVKYNE